MEGQIVECYRCGAVFSIGTSECTVCGSLSVHLFDWSRPAAYSVAGAEAWDTVTRETLETLGASVRVSVMGSAVSYLYDLGRPESVSVCIYGERRAVVKCSPRGVGDVVRVALADFHSGGGMHNVLLSSLGGYSVEVFADHSAKVGA